MIEKKIAGLKVKMYNSIDDLPSERYHIFNRFMLIDSGVGSDINDVNEHIAKIIAHIDRDDKKHAKIELENMRQLLYLVTLNISPKHLAFTALVHSINGNVVSDLTDDNLMRINKLLSKEKKKRLDDIIESLKKKISEEFAVYFEKALEDVDIKEYYDLLKKLTIVRLKKVQGKEYDEEELKKLEIDLLVFYSPKVYSDGKLEVEFDKSYEDMCLILTKTLHIDAKKITVKEFYTGYEHLKKEAKELEKRIRKGKKK